MFMFLCFYFDSKALEFIQRPGLRCPRQISSSIGSRSVDCASIAMTRCGDSTQHEKQTNI